MIVEVTRSELIEVLLDLKGACPLTFTARTDADARAKAADKTPNPFPRPIFKTTTVNGMVNFWYDEGVVRRLGKEGKSPDDFRRGTSWHEPVLVGDRLTPLCRAKAEDNPNLYVRFMYLATVRGPEYADADGRPLTAEQVAPFLKPRSTYANQGLDAPLVFLTYNVDGIMTLTVRGQTYGVKPTTAVALA